MLFTPLTLFGEHRLLLISSTVKDGAILANAAKAAVTVIHYNAQTTPSTSLPVLVRKALRGGKADSIALALHDMGPGRFYLTGTETVTLGTTLSKPSQKQFWKELGELVSKNGRIDILSCRLAANTEGRLLVSAIADASGRVTAASINNTGNPASGGNWLLETHNVDLEKTYFIKNRLSRFSGVLMSQLIQVTAGDAALNDRFGYTVALWKDTAIVGAPYDDGKSGAAYIFSRNKDGNENWGQAKKLLPQVRKTNARFGWSVAIAGDTAVVGSLSADDLIMDTDDGEEGNLLVEVSNTGGAEIFINTAGSDDWGEVNQVNLTYSNFIKNDVKYTGGLDANPPILAYGDQFGYSVAVWGDIVLVGAPGKSSTFGVFAFIRSKDKDNKSVWKGASTVPVIAAGVSAPDRFGYSLAITGDTVIVGAPFANRNQGYAFIFYGAGTSWSQKRVLAGQSFNDYFGFSVDIWGDTAVVGAPYHDNGANTNQGRAYVYYRDYGGSENWGWWKTLTASDGTANDYFGWSVGISKDLIVVGAPDDDNLKGAAYLYHRDTNGTGKWGQVRKLSAGDGNTGDQFGISVDVYEDTVISGADKDDNISNDAGSAYLYGKPGIGVKQENTDIASGSTYDFGDFDADTTTDVTFTITNTGPRPLELTTPFTLGGSSEFILQQQPEESSIAPSSETNFIVRLASRSAGAKTAYLSIANTDYENDPYKITFIANQSEQLEVTTGAVTTLNSTTVSVSGNITADGGSTITARGAVWDTNPDPTTDKNTVNDSSGGTGEFTVNATGLSPGVSYYVRAFAANKNETAYGSGVMVTIAQGLPVVTTAEAADITKESATVGGNVTSEGGDTVTARGVCWSTQENPTTADDIISGGDGTGEFTASLTGLNAGTTYYVRAYAVNGNGTAYGDQQTFTTEAGAPVMDSETSSAVINATTVSIGGSATSSGGPDTSINERGAVYSTTPNPTINDNKQDDGVGGTGDFAVEISGLTPETTYYFSAYVTNASGETGYSDPIVVAMPAEGVLPGVDTGSVSVQSTTDAQYDGNISGQGSSAVTARGVCYSNSSNPTTADNIIPSGSGTGAFSTSLTGLNQSATYFVRGYATNSSGTAYGSAVEFTTSGSSGTATVPTVKTAAVSNISSNAASSGGNITSDGGGAISARGVCWNTEENPTTNDSLTNDGSGTGDFASTLTGLSSGTTYFVRAYATNSEGTAYGDQMTFTVGSPLVSGNIADADTGSGVEGVTVTLTNADDPDDTITTLSDFNGEFSTTVESGFSGDVTPAADGYTFDPASASLDNVTADINQDFSGQSDEPPPHLSLDLTRLNFGVISSGPQTGTQRLIIANKGGGAMDWSIASSADWISVSPTSGTGDALVYISINASGFSKGRKSGTLTVTSDGVAGSPVTVAVNVTTYGIGDVGAPLGSFDTPADGTVARGSIPVTGWAIDDIEISTLKIYSQFSGSSQQNYIGQANFVAGARPDIETAYPDFPRNSSAGWGYMLLTHYLPGGDGDHTIYAVATDTEGNHVTLGSKSITIDNANAVKPFGAIDTPAQGGDASGSSFVNWGWVLTPQPNSIPINGSTLKVWVDGVYVGQPVYNIYRADIAGYFPGYSNTNGAVGYFYLDTTQYISGIHTIQWTATDTNGNTDGIGSRFFTAINARVNRSTDSRTSRECSVGDESAPVKVGADSINHFLQDISSPLDIFRGYNDEVPVETINADDAGTYHVSAYQLERLVIELARGDRVRLRISGFTVVNNELKPLPPGSVISQKDHRFYWQPGPALFGHYNLVFLIREENGITYRKSISITISAQ